VYREVKNDFELISDEASEKRNAELEMLTEKNNTFPEVRFVLLSMRFIYDLKTNLQDQKIAKHSPKRPRTSMVRSGMHISILNKVVPHMACKV
jgi:hypothetical protein